MLKGEAVRSLRVGLFSEVSAPVRNGVVASVEMLDEALRARGHHVVCVTPFMPGADLTRGDVVRLPSLPLPTRTGYRLVLPILNRGDPPRCAAFPWFTRTRPSFPARWRYALRGARAFL